MDVLGYKYSIRYSDELKDDDVPDGILFGKCETSKWQIDINSAYDRINQETALVHEVIEAINSHAGLELNHQTICILEATIYNMIKQLESNEDTQGQC